MSRTIKMVICSDHDHIAVYVDGEHIPSLSLEGQWEMVNQFAKFLGWTIEESEYVDEEEFAKRFA